MPLESNPSKGFGLMPLKHPYRKGYRFEREVLKKFEEAGFKVVRSPASKGSGDLYIEGLGDVQLKTRKSIAIYRWFDGADALIVKADRKDPLVVLPLRHFLALLEECK